MFDFAMVDEIDIAHWVAVEVYGALPVSGPGALAYSSTGAGAGVSASLISAMRQLLSSETAIWMKTGIVIR